MEEKRSLKELSQLENIAEYHHIKICGSDDLKKLREDSTRTLNQLKKEKMTLIESLL